MFRRELTITVAVLALLTVFLAAAAAPVAAEESGSLEYEFVVTDDGDVETIEIRLLISDAEYDEWATTAEEEGHESVSSWYGEQAVTNEPSLNAYQGSDRRLGDRHDVTVEFTDVEISETEMFTTSADGDSVTWRAPSIDEYRDGTGWAEITYRVVMPGEITATNANAVDGETAVWNLHDEQPSTLSVQSSSAHSSETDTAGNPNAAEFTIDVTENGTVGGMDLVLSFDEETYSEWELAASFDGHESVADFFGSIFVETEDAVGEYTAEDRETENGHESHVRLTDIDLSASENMSVTTGDGTVRWESSGVEELSDDEPFDEITYVVEMPGDVTDSNAFEVSDDTAVWKIHEEHPGDLFVEAPLEGEAGSSDGDSDDGDGDDATEDGLPGLGVVTALAGLLGAVLLATRRSD